MYVQWCVLEVRTDWIRVCRQLSYNDKKNDNFCDLRFFKGILFQVFGFVEEIKQGKLVIDFKYWGSDHLTNIAEYAEDESEIAGLEFIDEILGTNAIRTSQEIVILTEHDEFQKKCTELGKDLEFQVLKYDEQSLE